MRKSLFDAMVQFDAIVLKSKEMRIFCDIKCIFSQVVVLFNPASYQNVSVGFVTWLFTLPRIVCRYLIYVNFVPSGAQIPTLILTMEDHRQFRISIANSAL